MKGRTIVWLTLSILTVLGLACCTRACYTGVGANYSDGSREGVVTKLSEKGIVWKSWEGEMLMALPNSVASGAQPEKFAFNVDHSAVEKVQAAMNSGKRVTLVYRQWWLEPITIENDHVVVDVKEAQ